MNEAEFQQHYSAALKLILPTFQQTEISSERSFSIKFGHHNVFVDGKTPGDRAKLGIYDILLSINGKPSVMLELKKPGLTLSLEDRDQGISYARLTDPITPITIITNGDTFNVYDSYTKDKLEDQDLNDDFFTRRIEQAANLSRKEYKDAIVNLVENDQRVLFDLLNSISQTAFNELIGSIENVAKPIIKDFSIRRDALDALNKAFETHQFITLTGDAFCGKTNLLHQFYLESVEKGNAVLYVNCLDFQYSIFRKLTNNIHSLLKFPIDEIKFKEWLLLHFNVQTEKKITIIFDHVRSNIDSLMMADISEFVDLFKMDGNRIIICADQSNYESIRRNSDRVMNTMVGNNFYEVELGKFSTTEFEKASQVMVEKYQYVFSWGANYTEIYRLPRIWRLLIITNNTDRPDKDSIGLIPSIPGEEFLDVFKNTLQLGDEVVLNFLKLADAFIEGISLIPQKHLLMARSLGLIQETLALKYLDERKIDSLILAGYLERRFIPGFDNVFVMKMPELLAGYAASALEKKYYSWFESDFDKAYKSFIADCEFLPYGELIATRFIKAIGITHGNVDLFSTILSELFYDEPKMEISTSAHEVDLYVQKLGKVSVRAEEGVESKILSNGFPHLILSYVLFDAVRGEGESPHSLRLELIGEIANKPYVVRRIDNDMFFHEGIPIMELGRLGDVIQNNIGIVEPITQALLVNLLAYPKLFESFFDQIHLANKYLLLNRIYIAARTAIAMNIPVDDNLRLCRKILNTFEKEIVPNMIAYGITTDTDSDVVRKEIADRLRLMGLKNRPNRISNRRPKKKNRKKRR